MTKVRKTVVTFLMGLVMSIALCFGVVLSLPTPVSTAEAATTYTTKDMAMMGSVAGWYGNGNFEIEHVEITQPTILNVEKEGYRKYFRDYKRD